VGATEPDGTAARGSALAGACAGGALPQPASINAGISAARNRTCVRNRSQWTRGRILFPFILR
jgi:hypothetical protein